MPHGVLRPHAVAYLDDVIIHSNIGWMARAVGVCGGGGVVLTSAAGGSGRAAPGRSSELQKIR